MKSKAFTAVSMLMVMVLVAGLLAACGATVAPTTAPEPTAAPAEPTAAPVEPTAAPVEPTAAPVEPTAAPVAAEKPVIVMALDSDLDNLEPTFFKTDSAYYLVSNVYQSLLHEVYEPDAEGLVLMGTNTFEPDGAESYTWSDNGECAIFKVRQGMKFSNGKDVTAYSFKYGMDRALLGPGYLASLM